MFVPPVHEENVHLQVALRILSVVNLYVYVRFVCGCVSASPPIPIPSTSVLKLGLGISVLVGMDKAKFLRKTQAKYAIHSNFN